MKRPREGNWPDQAVCVYWLSFVRCWPRSIILRKRLTSNPSGCRKFLQELLMLGFTAVCCCVQAKHVITHTPLLLVWWKGAGKLIWWSLYEVQISLVAVFQCRRIDPPVMGLGNSLGNGQCWGINLTPHARSLLWEWLLCAVRQMATRDMSNAQQRFQSVGLNHCKLLSLTHFHNFNQATGWVVSRASENKKAECGCLLDFPQSLAYSFPMYPHHPIWMNLKKNNNNKKTDVLKKKQKELHQSNVVF